MNKKWKSYIFVALFECILLGIILLGMITKPKVDSVIGGESFYYTKSDEKIYQNFLGEEQKQNGVMDLWSDSFILPKGIYVVDVGYTKDTDGGSFSIVEKPKDEKKDSLQADSLELHYYASDHRFKIWIMENDTELQCHFSNEGTEPGTMQVNGVHIYTSNQIYTRKLAVSLFFMILLDLFVLYCIRWKKRDWEQRMVPVGIVLITAIASIPLFQKGIPAQAGCDLDFHLYRIESILTGIREGMFPVKIQPNWFHDYGYATGVFYPSLFLYIPVMLRWIGFTVTESYKLFVVCMHLLTAVIAYNSFTRIARDRKIGLVIAAVYTLTSYRLVDIYFRAAVGEFIAISFFPWIVCGMYLLLTMNPDEKRYRRNMWYVILGYTGLLQSHILSCEMAGIFTIVLCIFCVTKVLQKKRFFALLQSVFVIIGINLFFLVPFLDYFLQDKFCVNDGSRDGNTIQENGVPFGRVFEAIYHPVDGTAAWDMPVYLGALFDVLLLITVLLLVYRKGYQKKNLQCQGMFVVLVLCVCSLGMSMNSFPYNTINSIGLLNKMIISIQFPWRFFAISQVLCAFLLCGVLMECKEQKQSRMKWILAGISVLCVVQALQFEIVGNKVLFERSFFVDRNGISSYSQGAGEYVISGTDVDFLDRCYVYNLDGNVRVTGYDLGKKAITVSCENQTEQEGLITIPRLAYRGYVAKNMETGERLEVTKDENNSLQVCIPAGFQGDLAVYFEEFWYWRLAEIVSVLIIIGLVVFELKKRQKQATMEV